MKDLEALPKLSIRGVIAPKDPLDAYGESFSAADVINFLEAHKEDKHILVEISSNGGSVSEGKEIYQRLKQSGKKITTLTYKANSIATLLMLAGDPRQRYIVRGGDFMIHAARIYGEDLVNVGELTAEDLGRIKREVELSTEEITDIYCKILGEEKREAITTAMSKNVPLGAREAIRLGFATGYYDKSVPIEASTPAGIFITASLQEIIQNKFNDDNMNTAVADVLKEIKMALASLIKTNKIRNQVTVKTVAGPAIYVEVLDPAKPEDLKGGAAFSVDEAGVPTSEALADGEYALESGEVLVVAGGVVSDIKPAVEAKKDDESVQALALANAEIVALKAQLADRDKLVSDNKEAIAQMSVKFSLLDRQLSDFKAAVPGDKGETKKKTSAVVDPKEFAKMGYAQRTMLLAKEKRAAERNK